MKTVKRVRDSKKIWCLAGSALELGDVRFLVETSAGVLVLGEAVVNDELGIPGNSTASSPGVGAGTL